MRTVGFRQCGRAARARQRRYLPKEKGPGAGPFSCGVLSAQGVTVITFTELSTWLLSR
jgi:hypothetical protein